MHNRPTTLFLCVRSVVVVLAILSVRTGSPSRAQSFDYLDRNRILVAVGRIKEDLEKNYYEPGLQSINLEERFLVVRRLVEQAKTLEEVVFEIGKIFLDFNDPGTLFMPPWLNRIHDYGVSLRMIGDDCYVTEIRAGSDAEAKGLKPGDRVRAVIHPAGRYVPSRGNLWKIRYLCTYLVPQAGLALAVESLDGQVRELEVLGTSITDGRTRLQTSDFSTIMKNFRADPVQQRQDEGTIIFRIDEFDQELPAKFGRMIDNQSLHSLILDLRGSSGGGHRENIREPIGILEGMCSRLFDREIKIADLKGRKELKPMKSGTQRKGVFSGKLVVLVDSDTRDEGEILARVIQLEKRGLVVGDQTLGHVKVANSFKYLIDTSTFTQRRSTSTSKQLSFSPWSWRVTVADVIMSDGQSLDGRGITPDKVFRPSAADLAAGRDPVLSQAAALLGITLSPEKAGSLFPPRGTIWIK